MSDIICRTLQSRNRIPLQALSDESMLYGNMIENMNLETFLKKIKNIFSNINFETIKEIDNKLDYLQELSKNDNNLSEISKVISQHFSTHKQDYWRIYSDLRSTILQNDKNTNLYQFKPKSNSLLSIVDIKMEIKEDNSLDKLISNLDLNENLIESVRNRFTSSTPSVRIYRETATNTDFSAENQTTQTESNISDNNFDTTQKFLYFHGQTKEINKLVDVLQAKNQTLESKCSQAMKQLSTIYQSYKHNFQKINCEKIDFCVNTCESWQMNYDKLLNDSCKLVDVTSKLNAAQNLIRNYENQIDMLKTENQIQSIKIETLSSENERLTQENVNIQNEISDIRDTNEFLNAEHQGLTAQMEKMQEDWTESLKSNEERLRKARIDFRKVNTKTILERNDFEFELADEKMRNMEDKMEVGYTSERIEKLLKDLANYPLFGSDLEKEIKDLKKKLSIMEDKVIEHRQQKEKLRHYKAHMVDKVDKRCEVLNKTIETLKGTVSDLESDNEHVRSQLDKFLKLVEELRTINLNFENRKAPEYCDSFRTILSKFDV